MLKTNQEMLEEKIAYADKKIANYQARIENITELIKYNRTIIDTLQRRRTHEKVFIDIEKNEAKKLKKNAEKISEYEQQLKDENVYLSGQLDIAERHLASITETKEKLKSILSKTKKEKSLSK